MLQSLKSGQTFRSILGKRSLSSMFIGADGGLVPVFENDLDSSDGWNQTGTALSISTGKARAVNMPDNVDSRLQRAIGVTLSDTLFFTRNQFDENSFGSTPNLGVSNSTGNPYASSTDMLGNFSSGKDAGITENANGTNTIELGITHADNVIYFEQFERRSATLASLNVFQDSDYTNPLATELTKTIQSLTGGFDNVQIGGNRGGGGGQDTWNMAILKIFSGVSPP